MLDAVEVPVVTGHDLVVPLQFPGVHIDSEDRADVQVVLVARRAVVERPRLRVARADVDETRVGVKREAVPYCAAAAVLPPFLVPRLGRFLQRGVLEWLRRIAR